ncbi:MAG: sulfurtransferase [Candidatus Eremiobacteraeota bacterium]|nr:sulfurtransferase [Candidatus Eremiobacteraeota bacterium]
MRSLPAGPPISRDEWRSGCTPTHRARCAISSAAGPNVPDVPELSAGEFARWREDGRPHVLLDVRLAQELAAQAFDGALHVPMHELPRRLDEIPRDRTIVVMCAHGERSWTVANYLLAGGFADVYNLAGGIDAYLRRASTNQ